jgi:glutathione S-transferase
MSAILYDLAGADDRRFSPHCWRTRMALAHKGLACEARPTRFCDIEAVAGGQFKTIPVIDDEGQLVADSWAIAVYLEQTYPDRPSLFGGPGGEALTRFVQNWCVGVLHAGMVSMIVLDIFEHLAPEDQAYFRSSREQRFGRTLEEVQAGRETRVEGFRKSLEPLRRTLGNGFLGGDQPFYADYLVFGAFQWARTISRFPLLADDDPIKAWFERCLDLYDGLGGAAPGYETSTST